MSAAIFVAIAFSTASIGPTSNVTYVRTMTDGITYPARLAPAPGGGLYVTDPPMKQVVEYPAAGPFLGTLYPIAAGANGIAVHSDGRVFISHNNGTIGAYSAAFALLPDTFDPAPMSLIEISDLAFDPDANWQCVDVGDPVACCTGEGTGTCEELYAVDAGGHQVLVFMETAAGTWTLVRSWGMEGSGLGEFAAPQAIALDLTLDRVIVTDADNFRVQVFDMTGVLLFKFGYRVLYLPASDTAWFARSEGVAVDVCSNIYVSDALMGTVRVFSSIGGELNSMHLPAVGYGTTPGTGQLRSPCDVAIDDAGVLYIASTNNGAVEVFNVTCSVVASAPMSDDAPRGTTKSVPLHRREADGRTVITPTPTVQLRIPDNPLEIVSIINGGDYCAELDLNRDNQIDLADLEIAVSVFGAGTIDDFLTMADGVASSDHPGLAPPHILDLPNRCGRCHSMDGAPGGMLTAAGQENLCQSCHSAGKIAGHDWVGPGSDANSHPWGIPADDGVSDGPEPGSDLALHLDDGDLRCGTCHEPHDTVAYPEYVRTAGESIHLCGECHGEYQEWLVAGHADEEGEAFVHYDWTLPNRASCRQCHSGYGYIDFSEGIPAAQRRGNFRTHDCLVCHATHGKPQADDLLRIYDTVTLPGQVAPITGVGGMATCMACHNGRYAPGQSTTPHYLLGGAMLEGINVFDFGFTLESSQHTVTGVTCMDCHMAPSPAPGNPGAGKVGGHTFNISWHESGGFFCAGGIDDGQPCTVDADCDDLVVDDGLGACDPADPDFGFENAVNACGGCHTGLTTINRPAGGDYDGNLVVEGVQDETQGLLDLVLGQLVIKGAVKLDGYPYWNFSNVADVLNCTGVGVPFACCTGPQTGATCPTGQLQLVRDAVWNWQFVVNSGDLGVKNTAYAVGALQVAYRALTGVDVPGATLRYLP